MNVNDKHQSQKDFFLNRPFTGVKMCSDFLMILLRRKSKEEKVRLLLEERSYSTYDIPNSFSSLCTGIQWCIAMYHLTFWKKNLFWVFTGYFTFFPEFAMWDDGSPCDTHYSGCGWCWNLCKKETTKKGMHF